MKKVKSFVPLILLLLPLFVIWMPWYRHMELIPEEYLVISANGIAVALEEHGRVGIIYILCIFIQFLGIKYKQYTLPIVANLILICTLVYYPLLMGAYTLTSLKIFINDYYTYGFYLAIIFIAFSILANLARQLKHNK